MLRQWRQRRLFRRLALAAVPAGEGAVTDALASVRAFAARQRSELDLTLPSLPPQCPRCGNALVIRLARQGRNAGNEFWGCSSWPQCDYGASLESYPNPRSPFRSYA